MMVSPARKEEKTPTYIFAFFSSNNFKCPHCVETFTHVYFLLYDIKCSFELGGQREKNERRKSNGAGIGFIKSRVKKVEEKKLHKNNTGAENRVREAGFRWCLILGY